MATALEPQLLDFTRLRAEIAHFQGVEGNPTSGLLEQLREELQAGRAEIRGGFEAGAGAEQAMRELCQQMDGLIQGILDFGLTRLYGTPNPTTGEQLAVAAVGGYGRKELAPGSDIDLLFLCHYKRTAHVEQMAEFLLYKLWDLGLKVGQSVRSLDECVKLARNDLTVRTALLEARLLWGSPQLFGQLEASFASEIIAGNEARFVEEKLAERDRRHQRMGDSRFLLEPNIKEGKGGLRDLQTLTWIGRFLFHSGDPAELVRQNLLTRPALRMFLRAHRFLWTVRCHLHYLTDRAEDRLTFDLQPEVARRMGFRERNKVRAVERFMKRYYLVAREVGTATRIFCAALEERHQRVSPLARLGFGRRRINGFVIQGNRLNLGEPTLFEREPVRMLELFHLAQERELDIHPQALAAVTHTLSRVDVKLRTDPEANRLFLDILCARKHPALALTRMNEVGLLGRFVPEFGRIVAQMQHNLYHIYTVDEHTIRAIDILSQIERGELGEELPLSTEVMPKLLSRREIYVATFLHDIAKGRGGDHSDLGAVDAEAFCLEQGLTRYDARLVAWLVKSHLQLSITAQKQDITDPQVINGFAQRVGDETHLDYLYVLTCADVRGTNPKLWNSWKASLFDEFYERVKKALRRGLEMPIDPEELIAGAQQEADHRPLSSKVVNGPRLGANPVLISDDVGRRDTVRRQGPEDRIGPVGVELQRDEGREAILFPEEVFLESKPIAAIMVVDHVHRSQLGRPGLRLGHWGDIPVGLGLGVASLQDLLEETIPLGMKLSESVRNQALDLRPHRIPDGRRLARVQRPLEWFKLQDLFAFGEPQDPQPDSLITELLAFTAFKMMPKHEFQEPRPGDAFVRHQLRESHKCRQGYGGSHAVLRNRRVMVVSVVHPMANRIGRRRRNAGDRFGC